MNVFVANGTYQHMDFNYRLPEMPSFRRLEIKAGRQEKFPEDLNDLEVESLIKQLERFGAVQVSDVKSITIPRSLVYSVDRKISSDKINEAREKDVDARQEVAAEMLTNAGLAQFPQDEQLAAVTKSTSLEVVQLDNQGKDAKNGVDAEVVVSKTAGKRETTTRRRR